MKRTTTVSALLALAAVFALVQQAGARNALSRALALEKEALAVAEDRADARERDHADELARLRGRIAELESAAGRDASAADAQARAEELAAARAEVEAQKARVAALETKVVNGEFKQLALKACRDPLENGSLRIGTIITEVRQANLVVNLEAAQTRFAELAEAEWIVSGSWVSGELQVVEAPLNQGDAYVEPPRAPGGLNQGVDYVEPVPQPAGDGLNQGVNFVEPAAEQATWNNFGSSVYIIEATSGTNR